MNKKKKVKWGRLFITLHRIVSIIYDDDDDNDGDTIRAASAHLHSAPTNVHAKEGKRRRIEQGIVYSVGRRKSKNMCKNRHYSRPSHASGQRLFSPCIHCPYSMSASKPCCSMPCSTWPGSFFSSNTLASNPNAFSPPTKALCRRR